MINLYLFTLYNFNFKEFFSKNAFDSFVDMAISSNNEYLAILTNTNYLWIGFLNVKV